MEVFPFMTITNLFLQLNLNIKKKFKNQIKLPCLFLEKYKRKLDDKILFICTNVPKYPKHFSTGPLSDEINFNYIQIKIYWKILKKK